MPHRRVPEVTEYGNFIELFKSLEKWHQKELRPSRNQYTGTLSLLGEQKKHP